MFKDIFIKIREWIGDDDLLLSSGPMLFDKMMRSQLTIMADTNDVKIL